MKSKKSSKKTTKQSTKSSKKTSHPPTSYKVGEPVLVYGTGVNESEFHDGCIGVVDRIEKAHGCVIKNMIPIIGVDMDGTFDWFHSEQLKRIMK